MRYGLVAFHTGWPREERAAASCHRPGFDFQFCRVNTVFTFGTSVSVARGHRLTVVRVHGMVNTYLPACRDATQAASTTVLVEGPGSVTSILVFLTDIPQLTPLES